MRWPINLVGLIMLILGGAIVINPEIVRKMIDFVNGIKARIYSIGVLRMILGALLIASAGNARLYGFVLALGIAILLAGIACFAIPYKTITKIIAAYREKSLVFYRVIGIILLVLSSILIFAC